MKRTVIEGPHFRAPCFVTISDLHAHPWAAFAKGDGLNNTRLQDSLRVLRNSLLLAQKLRAPWIFGGDIVHTAGYALNVVMAGLTDVLREFPDIEKLAVWGNHDARGVGGEITAVHTVFPALMYAVPKLTLLTPNVGVITMENGLTIAGAGYQPRPELLRYAPPADVGVYHQTVRGSHAPNGFALEEGLDQQELLDRYRVSIVGHVHHPQILGDDRILVPGSPEQQNFGDAGGHGYWAVTFLEGATSFELIPGGSPDFLTVETVDEIPRGSDNFYRVRTIKHGDALPEGVLAVAPAETTIVARDTLRNGGSAEEILQAWMKANPPDETIAADCLDQGRRLLAGTEPMRLRNLKLDDLILTNFCCFDNAQLSRRDGVWLVTGRGKDYPSNGAGKTTLVGEALYWLLTGRTTKGLSADDVIREGQDFCSVYASFAEPGAGAEPDGSGGFVEVIRSRGPDGHKLGVFEDGVGAWEAASVNEMTEKLLRYLGLTAEMFQNLAYFSQEKLLLFSGATDAERKDVLGDLMGLQAYQDASSAAFDTCRKAQAEIEKADATYAVVVDEQNQAETRLAEATAEQVVWEDAREQRRVAAEIDRGIAAAAASSAAELLEGRLARFDRRLTGLEMQFVARCSRRYESRLAEQRAALVRRHQAANDQAQVRRATLERKIAVYEPSVETARAAVANLELAREVARTCAAEYDKARYWAADAKSVASIAHDRCRAAAAAATKAAQQYEEAQRQFDAGVCPTCRQPITPEHREQCLDAARGAVVEAEAALYTADLAYANTAALLKNAEVEVEAREARNKAATKRHAALEALATLLAEYDRETVSVLDEAALEQHALTLVRAAESAELAAWRARQDGRVRRAKHAAAERLRKSERALADAQRQLDALDAAEANPYAETIEYCQKQITRLMEKVALIEHGRVAAQHQLALGDYWRLAFSRQGIQSLLIEEVAARFNAERGSIFPLLTQGVYDVQFSTLSRTRAGEFRERTEFFVYEHGQKVLYEALSGGQRRRIDIGIMLVMAVAVAKWMGTAGVLGVLILDEVFGFLDPSGAEGLVAALNQVTDVIPTVYVVSHDTALQALVPSVIEIEQDAQGVSRMRTEAEVVA